MLGFTPQGCTSRESAQTVSRHNKYVRLYTIYNIEQGLRFCKMYHCRIAAGGLAPAVRATSDHAMFKTGEGLCMSIAHAINFD